MSVILNMIVRNEEKLLPRCLESVRPFIDRWVILDTGSTDGTMKLLEEFKQVVPGDVQQAVWKNYGANRQEALKAARKGAQPGDYILFIDADETLQAEPGFQWPELTADCYNIALHYGSLVYWRPGLVKAALPWEWIGVVHEYVHCGLCKSILPMSGVFKQVYPEQMSAQFTQKYQSHVRLLLGELEKNPKDARSWFYLGQSFRELKQYDQAIKAYDRGIPYWGPNYPEEIYWSLLQIARMLDWRGADRLVVLEGYLRAHNNRPQRPEAAGELAKCARLLEFYDLATKIADQGRSRPRTQDTQFVEMDWYDWKLQDEFSISAFYVGRYAEALKSCEELLANPAVPAWEKPRIVQNQQFCLDKIREKGLGERFEKLFTEDHSEEPEIGKPSETSGAVQVVDACLFNGEWDMLEFRLRVLDPVVDHFVVVEGDRTFVGARRDVLFTPQKAERFKPYARKLRFCRVTLRDEGGPWQREAQQRDALRLACDDLQPQDVLILSDVDEIPSRSAVAFAKANGAELPQACEQAFFYYRMNNRRQETWRGSIFATVAQVLRDSPQALRDQRNSLPSIPEGGWHFSYFGGIARVQQKLRSFSHQEYNTPKHMDPQHIGECFDTGEDLFKRDGETVPVDAAFFPAYVNEAAQGLLAKGSRHIFKIIIPSKTQSNLQACLNALFEKEPGLRPEDVIVVDDGVQRPHPAVQMISGTKPFVFARNVNLGLRAAGAADAVVLNDDTTLETVEGLSDLVAEARRHPEYGVVCPALTRAFIPEQMKQGGGLREIVPRAAFVGVYIPSTTRRKLGLLDERFTGYGWDDDDYCRRVREAGLKVGVYDGCVLDHGTLPSTFRAQPFEEAMKFNQRLYEAKWAGASPAPAAPSFKCEILSTRASGRKRPAKKKKRT
jgi:glycosyltransferase involved in cell wall biosynthesis/GT2 family glycosyltransferase